MAQVLRTTKELPFELLHYYEEHFIITHLITCSNDQWLPIIQFNSDFVSSLESSLVRGWRPIWSSLIWLDVIPHHFVLLKLLLRNCSVTSSSLHHWLIDSLNAPRTRVKRNKLTACLAPRYLFIEKDALPIIYLLSPILCGYLLAVIYL